MNKIPIAVCDIDKAYGEKLVEWFSLEESERFLVNYFSLPEMFHEVYHSKRFEIVLLGTGFEEIFCRIKEEDQDFSFQKTVWLYLFGHTETEELPNQIKTLPLVDKFQPVQAIIRKSFAYFQGQGTECIELMTDTQEIIAVYSPEHSIWQTPVAFMLARILREKERVIYVSLKECAGFMNWFGEEYHHDLLDVMYLALENGMNFKEHLIPFVYTLEGVDYIPPVMDGQLLSEISSAEYTNFLNILKNKGGYDIVILDLGMMLPGFVEVLKMCSKVYVVSEQGVLQQGVCSQFEDIIRRQGEPGLEEKTEYHKLPFLEGSFANQSNLIQHWGCTELGDFVRRMVGRSSGSD